MEDYFHCSHTVYCIEFIILIFFQVFNLTQNIQEDDLQHLQVSEVVYSVL